MSLAHRDLTDEEMSAEVEKLLSWKRSFDDFMFRLSPVFRRRDTRKSAEDYVDGLLSSVDRKNSWQLAERLGYDTPYAIQHLLGRAAWDHTLLRPLLAEVLQEQMPSDDVILVLDETGFIKKGTHSAGVKRQYTGTAGRIENCQVGVFLAYTTPTAHALLDGRLFIPKSWADDPGRCAKAKIPQDHGHKTKLVLAEEMLEEALNNGLKPTWVLGDTVYGAFRLRRWLQQRQLPYILGVSKSFQAWKIISPSTVGTYAAALKESEWTRLSCGEGSKGSRRFDWHICQLEWWADPGFEHRLLIRRRIDDPEELAFFVCYVPTATSFQRCVEVCGRRWQVEECFGEAKGEVGLDEYEVRSWTGWHRHIMLALWAYAFLALRRIHEQPHPDSEGAASELKKGGTPADNAKFQAWATSHVALSHALSLKSADS